MELFINKTSRFAVFSLTPEAGGAPKGGKAKGGDEAAPKGGAKDAKGAKGGGKDAKKGGGGGGAKSKKGGGSAAAEGGSGVRPSLPRSTVKGLRRSLVRRAPFAPGTW